MDFLLRMFKSLANETRLEIIKLLVKERRFSLDDIVTSISRPYKTVAGHVKHLEKSGLLKSQRHRGEMLYFLNASSNLYYNQQLIGLIKKQMGKK